jgi:chemotaxis protein histidine kinase CheA
MSEPDNLKTEVLREFLLESAENLARMDQEMVQLEQTPSDPALLASIFRTIHTVKGTCGFFGFSRLEAVAHTTEHILNELRNRLDTSKTSIVLESRDALKRMLNSTEADSKEGQMRKQEHFSKLRGADENPCANTVQVTTGTSPADPVLNLVAGDLRVGQQTGFPALNAIIAEARGVEAGKRFAEGIGHTIEAIQHDTRSAVEAIAHIGRIISELNYFRTTSGPLGRNTVTCNDSNRNFAEAAAGTEEIVDDIAGAAITAQGTTRTRWIRQPVVGRGAALSQIAPEIVRLITT